MFVYKYFTLVYVLFTFNICVNGYESVDLDENQLQSNLAKGLLGKYSEPTHHLIKQAPLNTKSIPNVSGRLGESILMRCGDNEHEMLRQIESSSNSMPVLVNWFKHYSLTRRSDKPIYAKYLANNIDYEPHISRDYENRLQVVDKINLNISNLKAVDEALYECRLILFDKAYADSQTGSMFYLQVHVAPEFEYPNEEIVYFKPNIPIRLYCYAKGKPSPTITWYKNGLRLEANTSVLQETFQDESSSDIYEYRCRAENVVGQIEHTVKVIRSGSLFFTEPLKNLTVTEGTILNWPCLAQSNAEITYKWFKDSVSVQSHLYRWSDRGALFQDGMLYLLETYRNDSGLYECHAYTAGKRIETSAYLNVLYGPEIIPFPSPFYVQESSQSIVLDCTIKSNPSVIALEWFKDKYLLSNTNKYQILANNSLLIRNVQMADRGHYYCVCNNTIKKTASSVINVEILESSSLGEQNVHSTQVHTSVYKLPCNFGGDESKSSVNVKWFKINSKLSRSRFEIGANGSLLIRNVRPKDAGYYLCIVDEEDFKKALQNQRLVRFNVIHNKTQSYLINPVSSETTSSDLRADEVIELPLSPENVQVNQTLDGVLVKWTYPNSTPIRIEYFQIYYRELNERLTNTVVVGSSYFNYEWKTTEPINSNENSYLIEDADLVENQSYEIQLVSFSLYSKSVPTQTFKFKYQPRISRVDKTQDLTLNSNQVVTPYHAPFLLNHLLNLSQLDIVLIGVFFILLFVLVVCIIACVVYRRSAKKSRKAKKVDVDEWGFQSSSAATATFLSSSSSSEKSLNNIYNNQKSKMLRNSAIDSDLVKKPATSDENDYDDGDAVNYHNPNNDDDDDDDDHNRLYSQPKREHRAKKGQKLRYDDEVDEEEDQFDDDYYYQKPAPALTTVMTQKFKPCKSSAFSSTSTGVSSAVNHTTSSASSDDTNASNSPNISSGGSSALVSNVNTTSTSGVTSVSASNSVINSSGSSDDATNDECLTSDGGLIAIKTIKYNAKTNMLHQQPPPPPLPPNKNLRSYTSNIGHREYVLLNNSTKVSRKFLLNNRVILSTAKQQTNRDEEKCKMDEEFVNDVSIDVDQMSNEKSNDDECDYYNKDTPTSSNYSNSPSQRPENECTLYDRLLNEHNANPSPLPFPTSHFRTFQQKAAPQLIKLNSTSSLTMVSKGPVSSSYCFNEHESNCSNDLPDNENGHTNAATKLGVDFAASVSSTSSGCSSLDNNSIPPASSNVYVNKNRYTKGNGTLKLDNMPIKPKFTSDTFGRRHDSSSSSNRHKNNYQNYTTYRPILKSSKQNESQLTDQSAANNNNNRNSKIDYV